MVRGAFTVWEVVLVVTGWLLGILFKVLEWFANFEMPYKLPLVCFIIMLAALFPRPIWLAVNWKRLNVNEPFSGIISASDALPFRNGSVRLTTLTFIDKNGKQIEKTFAGTVLFMSTKSGEQCKVLYNESYPDDYVIMPAGQANAVTFAVIGLLLEIQLLIYMSVIP
ncbi:MAG: hypothetical protein HDT43_09675 [Ruminococcaceae bacterium]|nr:hypothetical protein [Oscillospiraceae bacterium]